MSTNGAFPGWLHGSDRRISPAIIIIVAVGTTIGDRHRIYFELPPSKQSHGLTNPGSTALPGGAG